jgi:hypothetical protein
MLKSTFIIMFLEVYCQTQIISAKNNISFLQPTQFFIFWEFSGISRVKT